MSLSEGSSSRHGFLLGFGRLKLSSREISVGTTSSMISWQGGNRTSGHVWEGGGREEVEGVGEGVWPARMEIYTVKMNKAKMNPIANS